MSVLKSVDIVKFSEWVCTWTVVLYEDKILTDLILLLVISSRKFIKYPYAITSKIRYSLEMPE